MEINRRTFLSLVPVSVSSLVTSTNSKAAVVLGPMWLEFVKSLGLTIAGTVAAKYVTDALEKDWYEKIELMTEQDFTITWEGSKNLLTAKVYGTQLQTQIGCWAAFSEERNKSCCAVLNMTLRGEKVIISLLEDKEMRALSETAKELDDYLDSRNEEYGISDYFNSQREYSGLSFQHQKKILIQKHLIPTSLREPNGHVSVFDTNRGQLIVDPERQFVRVKNFSLDGARGREKLFGPYG